MPVSRSNRGVEHCLAARGSDRATVPGGHFDDRRFLVRIGVQISIIGLIVSIILVPWLLPI